MEQFVQYGPWLVVVVIFLLQLKLFVRPEELANALKAEREATLDIASKNYITVADFEIRRANFQKYIADNYVSNKTYYYNHDEIKGEMATIRDTVTNIDHKIDNRNVEDRKMLIELMNILAKDRKE